MILHNVSKKDADSEMYFHVPLCADLIKVLAHASIMSLHNIPKKDTDSAM